MMHRLCQVNPFRCRMWPWHDRLDDHISEETCAKEIESFERHGQLVPVLGRAVKNDPDYDVELIFGARRLFVARHLNKPLIVELREVSDQNGIVAMDIENRHRLDISPYERGVSYAKWLRAGHFQSQDDLSRALRVSPPQVSRLLKLSRLPAAIVGAFQSPAEICEGWGADLIDALERPAKRDAVLAKARVIASSERRPAAREVYRQLISAGIPGAKVRARPHDEVVKNAAGTPLFRVRVQTRTIALLLPADRISASTLRRIRESVRDIMCAVTEDETNAASCGPPKRSGAVVPLPVNSKRRISVQAPDCGATRGSPCLMSYVDP